jgi:ABC-2 type transport system permease protein
MKALLTQTQAELTLFLRDKTVVFFSLIFPILTVAFFGYLNRGSQVPVVSGAQVGEDAVSYGSFVIAGGIGMVVSSAALQNLSTALARQRDVGILKRLGGTPLRAWALIGAKVLAAGVVILAQSLIMIAVNVLLFQARIQGSPFWWLVALAAGIVTFSVMGIALAGLCRNADAASAAGMAIALPMQFLCGTLIPLQGLPTLLRRIAQVLPLTYFVQALRGAMLTGGGPLAHARDWAILLGCLVISSLIALKSFRWE